MFRALMSALVSCTVIPIVSQAAVQAETVGTYLGQASTGESVYYIGAVFPCGDLPPSDECWWRTSIAAYRIGGDSVSAVVDCQSRIFREVWQDEAIVAQDLRPQSEAIRLVIDNACAAR